MTFSEELVMTLFPHVFDRSMCEYETKAPCERPDGCRCLQDTHAAKDDVVKLILSHMGRPMEITPTHKDHQTVALRQWHLPEAVESPKMAEPAEKDHAKDCVSHLGFTCDCRLRTGP